ncbi:unnamed protein product [Colias eurytheme]|nr:unnamed protein product [Colias eurytheme]
MNATHSHYRVSTSPVHYKHNANDMEVAARGVAVSIMRSAIAQHWINKMISSFPRVSGNIARHLGTAAGLRTCEYTVFHWATKRLIHSDALSTRDAR